MKDRIELMEPYPGTRAFKELPQDKQKQILLRKYSQKPVSHFAQLDGFDVGIDGGDDVMRPDKEGDWLSGGNTSELMSGGPNVRILISEGTSKQVALRLIQKLVGWLEVDNVWAANGVINDGLIDAERKWLEGVCDLKESGDPRVSWDGACGRFEGRQKGIFQGNTPEYRSACRVCGNCEHFSVEEFGVAD